MEPLISMIVPVYNVEKYLDYCMQSIFQQTYQNLEIILVDDGSTDSSGQMCDEYMKQDCRVKVIHKSNGGLSSARNAGLKVMSGDYLTFVDSDDYIRKDYVSLFYEYITEDQSDMVICLFKKVLGEEDFSVISQDKSKHFVFDRETVKYKMLSRQIPIYAPGKLYKARLAEALNFPEGRFYEDVLTSWNVIKNVDKVSYTMDRTYYYRQRIDSIVNSGFKHGRMDQLYFSQEILNEFKEKNKYYYAAVSRCFFSAVDNYTYVTKDHHDDYKELECCIKKYAKDVLKDDSAEKKLKIMAILAIVSPRLTRGVGKIHKFYNRYKMQREIK